MEEALDLFGLNSTPGQGKTKRAKKDKNGTPRKDATGEDEKYLYRKAVEIHGNNWKKVMSYMFQNGQFLPPAVYSKYKAAVEDARKRKPIRCRIANIGRKVKNSPEVTAREKVNVFPTSNCTVQEMAVRMQHAKEQEAKDPLNTPDIVPSEDSSGSDATEYTASSNETAEISAASNHDSTEPEASGKAASIAFEKNQQRPSKKRKQTKKSKLDDLMEQSSRMMDVAGKAAKAHDKYLKSLAANNAIDLSDSDWPSPLTRFKVVYFDHAEMITKPGN